MPKPVIDVTERARLSQGRSANAIYEMVARAIAARHPQGGTLLDVGCGTGSLWSVVRSRFAEYVGVDAVAYEGFPAGSRFVQADLDQTLPLPAASADVVVALETIEHLEHPRAFVRELARVARPGGWVIVTTPNQLSALSLLTLIVKQRFSAFQDVHYPAHQTALLEVDLRRIAAESSLGDVDIDYSREGRIVLTAQHYPAALAEVFPRLCSDNLMLVARRSA